jgi:hypothetical protein
MEVDTKLFDTELFPVEISPSRKFKLKAGMKHEVLVSTLACTYSFKDRQDATARQPSRLPQQITS